MMACPSGIPTPQPAASRFKLSACTRELGSISVQVTQPAVLSGLWWLKMSHKALDLYVGTYAALPGFEYTRGSKEL